ncbi:MAG: hypothetical protein HXS53_02035 [Theionarchaea archaeon]|nr:hypothetical protein [Theionarchaea archaeon]
MRSKGEQWTTGFFKISSPGEYFSEIHYLASSGFCDIVGHLEYFKQWGHYERTRYTRELTDLLQGIIDNGLILEVNTAGLRHAASEPYPSYEILALYQSLGGTLISLGSDAHTVDQLAFAFPVVISQLKALGFEGVVQMDKRKSSLIPFDSREANHIH